jgi:SHS2 domain-containing protein
MSKRCATFDHTADVGLSAQGDTLGELFEALGEGLTDVICAREQVAATEKRMVTVRAEDVEALAVDFLSAVRTAVQTDRFLVADVSVMKIDENAVQADLSGEMYDPDRHELKVEVKAVTYHQLKIVQEGDIWVGRVILDI